MVDREIAYEKFRTLFFLTNNIVEEVYDNKDGNCEKNTEKMAEDFLFFMNVIIPNGSDTTTD